MALVVKGNSDIFRVWRPALVLLLFSVGVVLVCTSYGFLRMDYPVLDGNWYFLCGKAWMEGMTPYVDFADSKGPLLWLIYGVGYLISPHSLKGMFPVLVLLFWLTYWFIYKAAMIITRREGSALVASMLMALPYFFPGMHEEIRGEDICQCMAAMALYSLLRIVYEGKPFSRYFLLLGAACGAAMMVKFSVGISLLALWVLIFISMVMSKEKRSALPGMMGATICGMVLTVGPFMLWFLIEGNLGAFLSEYFHHTGQTVRMQYIGRYPDFLHTWRYRLPELIRESRVSSDYFKLSLMALSLMPAAFWRRNLTAWILLVWFGVTVLEIVLVNEPHYYFSLAVFWLPAFSRLLSYARGISFPWSLMAGACVLAGMAIASNAVDGAEFGRVERIRRWESDRRELKAVLERHGVGEGASLAYYGTIDFGIHVPSGLLPGVKYWAYQVGSTPAMSREHFADIRSRLPGVVMVAASDSVAVEQLGSLGYTPVFTYNPRPDWSVRYAEFLYTVFVKEK